MNNRAGNTIYHIIAIVIVGIWGLTFISTKTLLIAGLTPEEIFLIRFCIAYAGMWLFELKSRPKLFCSSFKDELTMAVSGIMGGSLYFWSENTALQYTMASNVSFIVCTTPLLTALLYSAIKKVGIGKWTLVGSVMALLGIGMIAFSGGEEFHLSLIGDILALVASLTWAIYTIVTNDILKKYPSVMVSRKVFFYGLVTIIPVLLYNGWTFPLSGFAQTKVLLNILFLGVIASLICYAMWNVIIKKLGTVSSSNYIYLNPLFTLLGAALILGERLAPVAIVGCVLTLAGVWTASRD